MRGLCAGRATAGEDLWTSDDPAEREAAKLICDRCPVAAACLRVALERGEKWGVWAGMDLGVVEMAEPATVRVSVYAPAHGSRSRYTSGCRCQPCTAANSAYVASRRLALAHSPAPVSAPVEPPLALFAF